MGPISSAVNGVLEIKKEKKNMGCTWQQQQSTQQSDGQATAIDLLSDRYVKNSGRQVKDVNDCSHAASAAKAIARKLVHIANK